MGLKAWSQPKKPPRAGMFDGVSKWWGRQMASREKLRVEMQAMADEENRIANQQGTWQNWAWTHIPQPVDFVGIAGTPYNLGSVARKWSGKPQLGYDVGQFMFDRGGSNLSLEQLEGTQRLPAIADDVPWVD